MKKMMMSLLIPFLAVNPVFAGHLAKDVKITGMGTQAWSSYGFFVTTAGGSGLCAGKTVHFNLNADSINPKIQDMNFQIAMEAFKTGKTVNIYSYENKDCKTATTMFLQNK